MGAFSGEMGLLAAVMALSPRYLISPLRVDEALRQFCGWASERAVPHDSKFSRAFAEFAVSELPQHLHQAIRQNEVVAKRSAWHSPSHRIF